MTGIEHVVAVVSSRHTRFWDKEALISFFFSFPQKLTPILLIKRKHCELINYQY